MEVQLQSGSLTIESFLDEFERYLKLKEDIKDAEPTIENLDLEYIAHDLASHKKKPYFESYEGLAKERGFADENGYTRETIIFAEGMLLLGKEGYINIRDVREAILNWNEVEYAFRSIVAVSQGEELPEPYPSELDDIIVGYACGLPGAYIRLYDEACKNHWKTVHDIVSWVGYPLEEATSKRASFEICGRKC